MVSSLFDRLYVRVYKDSKRQWRWSITHPGNRKIVGASTEGYRNRGAALRNFAFVTGVVLPVPKGYRGEYRRVVEAVRRGYA